MKLVKHIAILLALTALVFVLFGKTLNNRFNSDDYLVIYHAGNSLDTAADAFKEFLKPSWGLYYRPLITIFFDVLESSFGVAPMGYHLVSLLCYAVLCIEVYFFGLLLTKKVFPALAASLFFMAMTSHAQAIFWISSLNGVVENMFTLGSLALFILWRQRSKPGLYLASVGLFLVAVFLKESAVSLPLILVLYDALLGGEFRWPEAVRRTARSTAAFFVVAVLFVGLRSLIMRQIHLPPSLTSFQFRTAVLGSWHVLLMTLTPIDWALTVRWFNRLAAGGAVFYVVATIALLSIAAVPLVLKKYRVLFLVGWMIAGVVPVLLLGLVPSERHVVLSSAGAAILIAIVCFRLADHFFGQIPSLANASALVLVLIMSAMSFFYLNQRRGTWKTASDIAAAIVSQTLVAYPAPTAGTTFFFLNVPDTYDGAFVFRFENLGYALRLFYRQPSIEVVRIVTPERIAPELLTDSAYAYFRISAMGGNISCEQTDTAPPVANRLDRIPFLSKNSYFLDNWSSYRKSPFLVYSGGRLISAPPEELKRVIEALYSVS